MIRAVWLLVPSLALTACAVEVSTFDASLLDGAVPEGGAPDLGSGGNQAPQGSGGSAPPMGSGGAAQGNGGSGDPAGCGAGEKLCGGICVTPAPGIGCGLDDCRACPPAPANAEGTCQDTVCAWACRDGFERIGAECVVEGGQGSGGSGNTGGAGSPGAAGSGAGMTCGGQTCPPCGITGPLPCCTGSNECGCTWFPVYCN